MGLPVENQVALLRTLSAYNFQLDLVDYKGESPLVYAAWPRRALGVAVAFGIFS